MSSQHALWPKMAKFVGHLHGGAPALPVVAGFVEASWLSSFVQCCKCKRLP